MAAQSDRRAWPPSTARRRPRTVLPHRGRARARSCSWRLRPTQRPRSGGKTARRRWGRRGGLRSSHPHPRRRRRVQADASETGHRGDTSVLLNLTTRSRRTIFELLRLPTFYFYTTSYTQADCPAVVYVAVDRVARRRLETTFASYKKHIPGRNSICT